MVEKINIDEISWLEKTGENEFTVKFNNKTFLMTERNGREYNRCKELSTKTEFTFLTLLASSSLIQPKLTPDEIYELLGSEVEKLQLSAAYIYNMQDLM